MAPAIYLDTNAIIEFVEKRDARLAGLFARAEGGALRLVTSQLSLAELLVRPLRDKQEWLIALYDRLLSQDTIVASMPVDLVVLRRSAELRVELGGKLPDSVHISTALSAGCRYIISSDLRLRVPAGIERVPVTDIDIDRMETGS